MWFENLTGFKETSPAQIRAKLALNGDIITSMVNGRSMICGQLEIPCLAELRSRVKQRQAPSGTSKVHEVISDVRSLHTDVSNAGALFQVASQFNLLEMPGPSVTPENGISSYEGDITQGPACAVAAGAGTIFRNYFAPVNGQVGQTADNQIDCLRDIGLALGNNDERLWRMQNGYALATEAGLEEVSRRINSMDPKERDALRQQLRIGLQWNTQVTLNGCEHLVSQAYCSALPVGYSRHPPDLWEPFAQLVLEASYEATLCAALLNYARTGNNKVYLTLIGGGVFGNELSWIIAAIKRAAEKYSGSGIDIAIVSHRVSNPRILTLSTADL